VKTGSAADVMKVGDFDDLDPGDDHLWVALEKVGSISAGQEVWLMKTELSTGWPVGRALRASW
jgi:hypothetical protein